MQPFLAASVGDYWPLIIGAIFAAIKWFGSSLGEEKKPETPTIPKRPANRSQGESEEERARRFMEALGLPTGEAPKPAPPRAQPRETPASMRQEVPQDRRRKVGPPAIPPIIPAPVKRPVSRPPILPPSLPPVQPVLVTRAEERSLDSLDAPTTPAELIRVPGLAETGYRELRTHSSEVSAIPFESIAMTSTTAAPARTAHAQNVRALLLNPATLRSAVILREILGPPPGLQSLRPSA